LSERLFTVGKIVNTHGIRGELKIVSQTDFPENRFKKGSTLVIYHPDRGDTVTITVEGARQHKGMYIVKFAGYNNINDVEKFKGMLLKVREQDLSELDEGEYYYHQIIGCRVITDEGEPLGTVSEILSPGANDVWIVERAEGKPVLLPVIDDVILNIDIENRQITVHLMEGLLD